MAGLTAIASVGKKPSSTQFLEIVSQSLRGALTIKEIESNPFCQSALSSTSDSSGSSAESIERGVKIIVDGYFIETLGCKISSASFFLDEYLKSGLKSVNKLNGSFNIIIINNKEIKVTVISDRYGTRPLFYYRNTESLALSYSSSMLIDLGITKKTLNMDMVANHLSYSRVWLNDETFFKGIYSVPRSAIISWSETSGVVESFYSNEESKISFDGSASVEGLAELLKKVVSDFNKVNNLGLSLTGGLDSRILLAAGFDGNTFTWGYNEDNDEITLAKRCSETNLNPWKFIKVTPEEFLDPSGAGDFIREGLDLFVQSHGLICYPEVRDSGVSGLMTGLALDFTMAGSYCPSNAHDMSEQKMYDYAFKKIETFSSEDRSLLFKDKSLIERVKNIESAVKNELSKDFSKGSAVSALQNFFMENRVRRQIFQRQQWQRAYCEDYIPTFDNRLVDYLSRFSLEERSNHKIFQKVLLLLSSNLASIPYQGTNLPASVPVEYWESATQIEAMKEQLYRKIFNETTGMVFVPYNRYYSNFDEWMRTNAEWQNHIADLLLSDKSRILGFLNRNVINTWVNDQISAKIPRYGKIIELMNLEKTLRAFF